MIAIPVKTRSEYSIYVGKDLSKDFVDYCAAIDKRFAILVDENIFFLGKKLLAFFQKKKIPAELFSVPAGEKNKTRETKQLLEDQLLEKKFGRDSCFIAIGGGVTTDIVGFLAATYCRGVPVIYFPTSLLAMVDASVGGKTAVNTPFGKNLIGTFTQPLSVWIDVESLETLPPSEWENGLVEMLKHGLIADKDYFIELKNYNENKSIDWIVKSCQIKKAIVEQDEHDLGIRQLLNYGHTIGHGIESIANYKISHGQAVALGIMVESYIAMQLGVLSKAVFEVIYQAFQPIQSSVFQHLDLFMQSLQRDKKSKKNIPHFVLLQDIGKPQVIDNQYSFPVSDKIIHQALIWAKESLSC